MRLCTHQSKYLYNLSYNNHDMNFDKNSNKNLNSPSHIQVPLGLVPYSA